MQVLVLGFFMFLSAVSTRFSLELDPKGMLRVLLCCVNLSPKLTSPDAVSVTQLLPPGTHFLEQYSKSRQ